MDDTSTYCSPLGERYKGELTSRIFSPDSRYATWRKLWVILAQAEQKCGLPISDAQIHQMQSNVTHIPYDRVRDIEKETGHDVVAHLKAYAEQCPDAAPIIHLGATSCYITDNADVILMRKAIDVITFKLGRLVDLLAAYAHQYSGVAMVGRTHFQPAQPVTLGKRFAMWSQDFDIDLENMMHQKDQLRVLGCRGATGTADSFLQLFDGDASKVEEMEDYIVGSLGSGRAFTVSGQTYSRKQDYYVLHTLSGIAQSATKFATDIRLLAGLGEVSESFGDSQVGSSAMPYKQNPIACEKICGLSRYVMAGVQNAAFTASSQWLERTLDDSSNRRVVIPEMFIITEHVITTCIKTATGLNWHFDSMNQHVLQNASNAMVEGVLAESTKRGGNRQVLHEKLRKMAMSNGGLSVDGIAADSDFRMTPDEVREIRNRCQVGLAEKQAIKYADPFIL